jgi:hypothetical protein
MLEGVSKMREVIQPPITLQNGTPLRQAGQALVTMAPLLQMVLSRIALKHLLSMVRMYMWVVIPLHGITALLPRKQHIWQNGMERVGQA